MSEFDHYEIGLFYRTNWLAQQIVRTELEIARYKGKGDFQNFNQDFLFINIDGKDFYMGVSIQLKEKK
jgi:hypothetical protein